MFNSRLLDPRNIAFITVIAILVHLFAKPFYDKMDGDAG